jgi:hypothetical protein
VSGEEVASRSEVLSNRSICGEKPLRMTRRLEPLHTPLPLACRLMGVLRAIVQIAVLTMFDTRQNLSLRRAIAFEFVRDDDPRDVSEPFEQLTEELLRGCLVPTALHQDIEPISRSRKI